MEHPDERVLFDQVSIPVLVGQQLADWHGVVSMGPQSDGTGGAELY